MPNNSLLFKQRQRKISPVMTAEVTAHLEYLSTNRRIHYELPMLFILEMKLENAVYALITGNLIILGIPTHLRDRVVRAFDSSPEALGCRITYIK